MDDDFDNLSTIWSTERNVIRNGRTNGRMDGRNEWTDRRTDGHTYTCTQMDKRCANGKQKVQSTRNPDANFIRLIKYNHDDDYWELCTPVMYLYVLVNKKMTHKYFARLLNFVARGILSAYMFLTMNKISVTWITRIFLCALYKNSIDIA